MCLTLRKCINIVGHVGGGGNEPNLKMEWSLREEALHGWEKHVSSKTKCEPKSH